jgi:transcriptional regulator with XRE-family HTH domain
MILDENVGSPSIKKCPRAIRNFLLFRQHIAIGNVMSITENGENNFGERLREAREARSLNQTELARLANLQPAAIGHFEKGRRKPSFANIKSLAKALNVTSDFLFGRASELGGATTAFRNEENLSGADRESIQMMIDTLARRRQERSE